VDVDVSTAAVEQGIQVTVRVRLSGREANRLFLNGDTLIQLPLDGAVPDEATPIPRMSIFLSELAGSRDGLARVFVDDGAAQAYAAALRTQLEDALEGP
jgi:hypothetical protein